MFLIGQVLIAFYFPHPVYKLAAVYYFISRVFYVLVNYCLKCDLSPVVFFAADGMTVPQSVFELRAGV